MHTIPLHPQQYQICLVLSWGMLALLTGMGIVLASLAVLLVPRVVTLALRSVFQVVQMTLYSPWSIRYLFLRGKTGNWAVESVAVHLTEIALGFSWRKMKFRLRLERLRLYLVRRKETLHAVNLVEQDQQGKILANFLDMIVPLLYNKHRKGSSQLKGTQIANQTTLHYFLGGLFHLMMLLLMHATQIQLNDVKVYVVPPTKNVFNMESESDRRKALAKMQIKSQYRLECDTISMSVKIQRNSQYRLRFASEKVSLHDQHQFMYPLIEMKECGLDICVPFLLSVTQSLSRIQFGIRSQETTGNLTPSSFVKFVELCMALNFAPSSKHQTHSRTKKPQSQHGIALRLGSTKLNIRDLYEPSYDTQQAKQYLSNIALATLQIDNFNLNHQSCSVDMSVLSFLRYGKISAEVSQVEILRIPSLVIQHMNSRRVEVTHGDVAVTCHRQEIALLGKIFTIVDSRIRFSEYDPGLYEDLINCYHPGGILISFIEEYLQGKGKPKLSKDIGTSSDTTMTYSPQKLMFLLKMNNLKHVVTIQGFRYTRKHDLHSIIHQISCPKSKVEYRKTKEFIVSDFSLVYALTNKEKQLVMSVGDILMNQNQETLTDYLDSFTMFKHLLQFESNAEISEKPTKISKKFVKIQSITCSILNERITLKELKIDKFTHLNKVMDTLDFFVGGCSIDLKHLRPTRKLQKFSVQSNQSLFQLTSLSIRNCYEHLHGAIIPRGQYYIKQPQIVLPEVDISDRVLDYIKMWESMQGNIHAYLQNITNHQLNHRKQVNWAFLQQMPRVNVAITHPQLVIKENSFDLAVLGLGKLIREHLGSEKEMVWNEAEVISRINRIKSTSSPLIEVKLQKISCQLGPIEQIRPEEESVRAWIDDFEGLSRTPSQRETSNQNQQRIRRTVAVFGKAKIQQIRVKARDYAYSIFDLSEARAEVRAVETTKLFGEKMLYLTGKCEVGKLEMCTGLNQLSCYNELIRRYEPYLKIVDRFGPVKSNRNKRSTANWWHRLLRQCQLHVQIVKETPSQLHIMTTTTPYQLQDILQITLGPCSGLIGTKNLSFKFEDYSVSFRNQSIVYLPQLSIFSHLEEQVSDQFWLKVEVETGETPCSLTLSKQFIVYFVNLPELYKDWLLVYGIFPRMTPQQKDLLIDQIPQMNYSQLASLLLERRRGSNTPSILDHLSKISISVIFGSIKVSVINSSLRMTVHANQISHQLALKPQTKPYPAWLVSKSVVKARQVKAFFDKLDSHSPHHHRNRSKVLNHYQLFSCQGIVLNHNAFMIKDDHPSLIHTYLTVEHFQGEVSQKTQDYCRRMLALLNEKILIPKYVTERKVKKDRALKRFRKAVIAVIRLNRRRKMRNRLIEKYSLVLELESYKIAVAHQSTILQLTSKKPVSLTLKKNYINRDPFQAHPLTLTSLTLNQTTIRVSQTLNESFEVMFARSLSVSIESSDDSHVKGDCTFDQVDAYLTAETKDMLMLIIQCIMKSFNTRERKSRRYLDQSKKYAELTRFKRQGLKQHLQNAYEILPKQYEVVSQWEFKFNDLALSLYSQDHQFLLCEVGNCNLIISQTSHNKTTMDASLYRMRVTDKTQLPLSQYRNILEIGRDNVGLKFHSQQFQLSPLSDIPWSYHEQLSLWVQPITVSMTSTMLKRLLVFVGDPNLETQEEHDPLDSYQRSPDYYKHLVVEPIALTLSYRSQSMLKNMQGIRISLDKLDLKDKLYTGQQLVRKCSIWVVKEMARQSISVLGQKLFGS